MSANWLISLPCCLKCPKEGFEVFNLLSEVLEKVIRGVTVK